MCSYSSGSYKLSGNIIGTSDAFDYEKDRCSTTVNVKENAFDGDLNTIFATCQRTGGWVGLDLGEKHVITKVAYCPRKDEPGPRMLLGVFEGANLPDFGDAVPIYMITQAPAKEVMTEQPVDCSRGFRYVRYVGPNDVKCNLAELEFYGYKSDGDDSRLAQITNLPSIVIHTTNAQDITSKQVYVKGIISVISENGTDFYSDSIDIRGRGNNSWTHPKKPYRVKLYKKASLLNQPARLKNWTLINNYGDKTLMRNLLAFDLSKRFEFAYTPAGVPVNVFLNGEFKGCYQLCDRVEVNPGRVEVREMSPADRSGELLTGGYLIEMDAYAHDDPDKTQYSLFDSNIGRIPVTIKSPKKDEIVREQYQYISNQFNLLETAVYQSNYNDPVEGFRKYMDTSSFVRHFLVGEISGNTDTYWSTFMYKNQGDEKFYFGPVWDFDLAYENDNRTYRINDKSNWLYASNGSSSANGVRFFVNRLLTDNELYKEIRTTYAYYRDKGIINEEELLAVIDKYAEEIEESQQLNFMRWPIMNSWVHMNPKIHGSYEAEVENVRNYIRERIQWMDKKLAYTPSLSSGGSILSDIIVWTDNQVLYIERLSEVASVSIADITGRTVLSRTASRSFTTTLPKGIYIITVKNSGEMPYSQKIIIP